MSRVYDLLDLMNDNSFCDYIQEWADRTGSTYSEIYDKVLDDNIFCELVVDGYFNSKK